jgi:hypothetical protein
VSALLQGHMLALSTASLLWLIISVLPGVFDFPVVVTATGLSCHIESVCALNDAPDVRLISSWT